MFFSDADADLPDGRELRCAGPEPPRRVRIGQRLRERQDSLLGASCAGGDREGGGAVDVGRVRHRSSTEAFLSGGIIFGVVRDVSTAVGFSYFVFGGVGVVCDGGGAGAVLVRCWCWFW